MVRRMVNLLAAQNGEAEDQVDEDADMELRDWIDPENFNPGYLMRGMHLMPRRGDKPEWMHNQDYWREAAEIPAIDLDGAEFAYGGGSDYGLSSRSRNRTVA